MIRQLVNNEIDPTRWDDCILQSSYPYPYARYRYLSDICTSWKALVWEEDNKYLAVLPVPTRVKYGLKYVYMPYYAHQLGLISTPEFREEEKFMHEAIRVIDKFIKVDYTLNFLNKEVPALKNLKSEVRCTYQLPLNKEYELIRKKYNRGKKNDLNKARDAGLTIEKVENPDNIIDLFIQQKGDGIKGLTKELNHFRKVIGSGDWNFEILEAKSDSGKFVGGSIFLVYENFILYLMGISTEEGKKGGASTFLLDHMIQQYSNSDMTLDFEGGSLPTVGSYFESFGSHKVEFTFLYKKPLQKVKKLIKR